MEGKEKLSPTPLIREKQGEKKASPRFLKNPTRPRARAYAEARAAADYIIENFFGTVDDRNVWAACIYHHPGSANAIIEMAVYYASKYKQERDPENPITAFQDWINKNFPKTVRGKEVR